MSDQPQDTSTDTAKEEGSTFSPHSPAAQAFVAVRVLMERQAATTRHIKYLQENAEAIDDRTSVATERLKFRYPEIENAQLKQVVSTILAKIEEGSIDQESINDFEDQLITTLGPDYRASSVFWDAWQALNSISLVPTLFQGVLTSIISDIESFFLSIVQALSDWNPGALIKPNQKIEWQFIEQFKTVNEIRTQLVAQETDALFRDGLEKWLDCIADRFDVRLPANVRQNDVIEPFLRRNSIIHNGGRASRQYVADCTRRGQNSKFEFGDVLTAPPGYLHAVTDRLARVAFELAANAIDKTAGPHERDRLESEMANVVYQLLVEKRYGACIQICDSNTGPFFKKNACREIVRVNGWLSKRELGRLDECRKEIEEWDTSGLSIEFKTARLTLLGQYKDALELIMPVVGSPQMPMHHWRTWPLFAELRKIAAAQGTEVACLGDPDVAN